MNKKNIRNNLNKIKDYIIDKKKLNSFEKLDLQTKLKYLQDKLIRPIDAIKHQAKTVTVGAIRSIETKDDKIIFNNNDLISNFRAPKFNEKFNELDRKINIVSDELFEYEKYYLGNIIEYCNNEFKTNKYYKFPLKKNQKLLKKLFQHKN